MELLTCKHHKLRSGIKFGECVQRLAVMVYLVCWDINWGDPNPPFVKLSKAGPIPPHGLYGAETLGSNNEIKRDIISPFIY